MYNKNIDANIENAQIVGDLPISKTINDFIKPYKEGSNFCHIVGSSLEDWVVAPDNSIQKCIGVLEQHLLNDYGIVTIHYSLSGGTYFDRDILATASDARTVDNILETYGLSCTNSNEYQDEFNELFRGVFSFIRSDRKFFLQDGRLIKICLIIEFSSHLICSSNTGYSTNSEKMAIELAIKLSTSQKLRAKEAFIVFNNDKDELPSNIKERIETIYLEHPSGKEKETFVERVLDLYENTILEKDLTPNIISRLTEHTPNLSFEKLVRKSHRTGEVLTKKIIAEQRTNDIVNQSEGILNPVENSYKDIPIIGIHANHTYQVLQEQIKNILESNPLSIPCIMIPGSTGVGKTMLSIKSVNEQLSFYMFDSPKSSLVGESERKTAQVLKMLGSHKNVVFIDEFPKKFPSNQSEAIDGGITANLVGSFQNFWASNERIGEHLVIGTCNTVNKINSALARRFLYVPCLFPHPDDMNKIIVSLVKRIYPHLMLSETSDMITQAGQIASNSFYSPRQILKGLKTMGSQEKKIEEKHILYAIENIKNANQRANTLYCEYVALEAASNNAYLPWWNKKNYTFPNHLLNFIDKRTGEVIHNSISKEIKSLEPYVNF